jgi:hypothetical protein
MAEFDFVAREKAKVARDLAASDLGMARAVEECIATPI